MTRSAPGCRARAGTATTPGRRLRQAPPAGTWPRAAGPRRASATAWLATDAFSADLCVRLCVVSQSGCSENLQEGILRTSAASSGTSYLAQVPGNDHATTRTVQAPFAAQAARRHRVDLGPVARRLQPGERIRLQVSGSDHPLFDLNLGTGEPWSPRRASFGTTATQVIWHDAAHPSALLLPVIPDADEQRAEENR